jgi:protein SCO1/2
MTSSMAANRQTTETVTRSIARRRLWVISAVGLVLFVTVTTALVALEMRGSGAGSKTGAASLPDYGAVVDFALIESSGDPISLNDLQGTIWIANFIFTSCAGPCPQMTRRMANIQELLGERRNVRLVSISVDPDRDTPEVLRQYAEKFGARAERWWFLTGDASTIKRVAIDGFHIGSVDDPLLHSTKFALVDQHGHVRGYYDSTTPEAIDLLLLDVDKLSAAAAS